MSSVNSINYAKAIGLLGSGLLSGANLYISIFAVPAILRTPSSPKLLHGQWKYLYDTGKASFPPVSGLTALLFGYISYYSNNESDSLPFAVSAVSTLAIIPFTLVGMKANLDALLDEKDVWAESDRRRLNALMVTWRNLNFVRGGLLLVGFGTALVAAIC